VNKKEKNMKWFEATKKKTNKFADIDIEKINTFVSDINIMQKNKLAQYVSLRKVVLELFEDCLKWEDNENNKYEKEEVLHNIIFPQYENSKSISYKDHNLRILEEKLSYEEYVHSEMYVQDEKDNNRRVDLAVFGKNFSFRE
jgi:hypothetical protein